MYSGVGDLDVFSCSLLSVGIRGARLAQGKQGGWQERFGACKLRGIAFVTTFLTIFHIIMCTHKLSIFEICEQCIGVYFCCFVFEE